MTDCVSCSFFTLAVNIGQTRIGEEDGHKAHMAGNSCSGLDFVYPEAVRD